MMLSGSGTHNLLVGNLFHRREAVDPERLAEIPNGEPLRLVRIEQDLWTQALEPELQAPDVIQLPDEGVGADDRYAIYCLFRRAISKSSIL